MAEKNNIKLNYIYNLIYDMLVIILPIITAPYVSRVLGPDGTGASAYIASIVNYFSLIALTGTNTFGNREIAMWQSDKKMRSKKFWEIFLFRLFCVSFTFVIYVVFMLNFMAEYRILFIVHFLTILSWVADISWYFKGVEKFRIIALRNGIVKIVATIAIFIFVKSKTDLVLYVLIQTMALFVSYLCLWPNLRNEIVYVKVGLKDIFSNTKDIVQLFIPVIASQIYCVLDKTMLGVFYNDAQVSYYDQGEKIIKMLITLIASLSTVLMPRITNYYVQKNYDELNDVLKKSVNYIFMLSMPMMVGCFLVADLFVPWFFGAGYEPVIDVMRILSLLFVVLNMGLFSGMLLISLKRQKEYTLSVTTAAIVNLMFNLLFIFVFRNGAIGVAYATIIAEIIAMSMVTYYARDISDVKYVIKTFIKYIMPCFVMAAGIVLLRFVLTAGGFVELILSVFIGISVYFSVLFVMNDEMFISFVAQIRQKISKKS